MLSLKTKKTISTPEIIFDSEKNYISMYGESFPENVAKFYEPFMTLLSNYLKTDFGKLTLDCGLVYFNSSTSKLLLNVFSMLSDSTKSGNEIVVNWICNKDNENIIECGEEFGEDFCDIDFNIVLK